MEKQVCEMLRNDIIEPSVSSFNSNPLLVNKNDNSKRFVIDFRNLNKTTTTDSYSLPNVKKCWINVMVANFLLNLIWQVVIGGSPSRKQTGQRQHSAYLGVSIISRECPLG